MTAWKKCRPCTGRANTCVRLTRLLQREPMGVAGGPIGGVIGAGSGAVQRSKNAWTWPGRGDHRWLAAARVGTREETVVETLKGDVRASELLLDPLMPVETELDGIRQIRPELEKRRPPFAILHVEVVMIDATDCRVKSKVTLPRGVCRFCALNARIFLAPRRSRRPRRSPADARGSRRQHRPSRWPRSNVISGTYCVIA